MSQQKPYISLFDKSFSDTKAPDYDLFIQLGIDGLKYTVLDIEKKTFIALEAFRFENIYNDFSLTAPLKDLLTSNHIFKKKFNSIKVAYINNRSTLIPNAIFKADELEAYHQFNYTKQIEDHFFYDSLINISAQNIYSIPDFILKEFKIINNVTFKHFSSSLIEASLLYATTHKHSLSIDIHILPNSFQIIVVDNYKLMLFNSFEYQTSEDFIYYLLFVLNQLNIDNEKTAIRLLGEVEKKSAIYSMLNNYIKTINIGKGPENLKLSYVFEEIPPHMHYSLFNQFL